MDTVHFLAQLWGFSLVIIPLSFLINQKHAEKFLDHTINEDSLTVHGILRVVLGMAMVLSHNTWASDWKIIITVLGWLLLISGIGLLFFTKWIHAIISHVRHKGWIPVILVIVILIGCFLIYAGFTFK